MKIAVCDDDQSVSGQLEEMIERIAFSSYTLDCFSSGNELLDYLVKNNEQFNIYLLDIEMPGKSGIELAKELREADRNALIIFATSYKEYVYEVFEVLPFRFLCKPVEYQELKKVLQDAAEHISRDSRIFFFHIGREQYQVSFKEIIYFEGAGRKVILHSSDRTWEFYEKISKVLDSLDQSLFIRIHASYVVNMEQIRTIRPDQIELQDQTRLPVSRAYGKAVRQAHMEFLRRRGGLS